MARNGLESLAYVSSHLLEADTGLWAGDFGVKLCASIGLFEFPGFVPKGREPSSRKARSNPYPKGPCTHIEIHGA